MKRIRVAMAACLALAPLGGCAMLNHHMLRRIQAQQVANSRLTALAAVCVMALPVALWAGLAWGTKTISLRSWWLLLTIECVLFAMFAAAKAYFS